jgi:hypothetical protein
MTEEEEHMTLDELEHRNNGMIKDENGIWKRVV